MKLRSQIRHLGNRITRGNMRGNARRPARAPRLVPQRERQARLRALQTEDQQPNEVDGAMPQVAPDA